MNSYWYIDIAYAFIPILPVIMYATNMVDNTTADTRSNLSLIIFSNSNITFSILGSWFFMFYSFAGKSYEGIIDNGILANAATCA